MNLRKGISKMVKAINDVVYWLLSSGFLVAFIAFLWKYLKPLLQQKADHAATAQSREAWKLLEAVANAAVSALVNRKDLNGSDKFKQATDTVQQTMNDQGINVTHTAVANAVQAAYEKSSLTPTVKPTKKDPVLEAVKTAPNRANDLNDEKEGLQ